MRRQESRLESNLPAEIGDLFFEADNPLGHRSRHASELFELAAFDIDAVIARVLPPILAPSFGHLRHGGASILSDAAVRAWRMRSSGCAIVLNDA